jgi:hypothetical protein
LRISFLISSAVILDSIAVVSRTVSRAVVKDTSCRRPRQS